MIESVYLIELDCIYKSTTDEIKGANLFLSKCIQEKIPFILLSEQSGKTRIEMAKALREHGLNVVNELDIYTSSMAAVDYVVRNYPEKIKVAGIGGKGMKEAISKGRFLTDQKNPDLLFVGMNRNMTYTDYSYALQYLLLGAKLISTDSRRTMHVDGLQQIGNASIVKMLEYASNVQAEQFGRSSKNYFNEVLRFLKQQINDVIYVSDNFDKDIKPAMEIGMETVLITHGEGIFEMGINEENHPTYIVEDFYGLAK